MCVPPPPIIITTSDWMDEADPADCKPEKLGQEETQEKSEAEEVEEQDGDPKEEEEEEEEEEEPEDDDEGTATSNSAIRAQIADVPAVSEQQARTALLHLVADHCCWGKGAARNMNINRIVSTSAFHVIQLVIVSS